MGAREDAARSWFGYGRWEAPYWFVGMEPGGDDDHASYESWQGLGSHALIDCREHHEDSNRRAGRIVTSWHRASPTPPVQTTWGPLIQLVLSFEDRASERADVAAYQRDSWGRLAGDTTVLEISALHAANTGVDVERTLHRSERLAELKRQLASNQPTFAVFYGTTYRGEYEAIAGRFGVDGWRWTNVTLCVLTQHPAYRFAPPAPYWRGLGAWMREMVELGPGSQPSTSMPKPPGRPPSAPPPPAQPEATRPRPVPASAVEFDPNNPKHTVELLEQLIASYRFEQRHFVQLHHFGAKGSLTAHIKYCRGLKNDFTSETNATVARRLHRLLEYLQDGQEMHAALMRVARELPMPPA